LTVLIKLQSRAVEL